jgi:hypothetical protein
MNLRLAASLVFIGSLAYACGPRTGTDAAVDFPVASPRFALASIAAMPPTTPTPDAREKSLKKESTTTTLTTRFEVIQKGKAVRLALHVINSTGKRVEITYASGQAYDFVIQDSIGRDVWRWAEGRMFTQSVQNKLLSKGEHIDIAEEWTPAKPGKYTAIALLRSTNFPVQERAEFVRR